jgi:predicted RNase H-like nuclease (RuvC/YqgF family)
MPIKKLEVNLKPIKQDIEKAIKSLSGFKPEVSIADRKRIDLKVKLLKNAIKDLKQTCKNGKMTAAFTPNS